MSDGEWIRGRLRGWGRVGSVIPHGLDAYARVFHPARIFRVGFGFNDDAAPRRTVIEHAVPGRDVGESLCAWAEAARHLGRVMHPLAQWSSISGAAIGASVDLENGWRLDAPRDGRPEPELLARLVQAVLATDPPSRTVSVGVWNGWGTHPDDAWALRNGERLRLPGREYVVFAARLGDLADAAWADGAGIGRKWGMGPMPQLVWPSGREWCIASEIDWNSTIVGGSRGLIERILSAPEVEALEVAIDDDLSSEGDTLNR
ncbi:MULTISPECIES: hypothetical protein [Subtercola]|uniref:hypothetical protein n=1 Tax=Subtercola TaxID=120212 RepID=UPI0010AA428A|nr:MULTISPECIES: hypothetical protein [Subtercola]MEA9985045.1 hypothetical protein [Subtercola sp. RTI3]